MNRPAQRESGSTLPLILGFFIVALMTVAGAVAAGDAFVAQRDLQDVCDGAAAAAAASAADLNRGHGPGAGAALRFGDVQGRVAAYLSRDPSRAVVHVRSALSADRRTLTLTCSHRTQIAFGAMFGVGGGVRQSAHSTVRSPLS